MMNLLLIGLGGFIGSICRYALGGAVHRLTQSTAFPYGTIVVNVLGCLFIGVASGLVELRQLLTPEIRLFLLIGVLGGFTTFSTFGYETVALIKDGEVLRALINVVGQVSLGLLAVWVGFNIPRFV